MNMKTTFKRVFLLVLVAVIGIITMDAATIYYNGIKYSTSGSKATTAKYDAKVPDGIYKGEIVIPETFVDGGVTYTVVGTGANTFLDCVDITKIILPATCISIGRNSFKGCTSLVNCPVPATATSLGQGAYDGCTSMTEAIIPGGCTIGMNTNELNGCTSLRKLTIGDSELPLAFGIGMFGSVKPPLEELYLGRDREVKPLYGAPLSSIPTLKKIVIGDKVTTLQSGEFAYSSGLTEVVFGSGLTTMNVSSFAGCTSLKSVMIPLGITDIPNQAFSGCTSLTNVQMSANVKTISSYAFNGCPLVLEGFPVNVEAIGERAFYNGASATTLALPEKLKSIGAKAFFGCKIENIEISASVTSINAAAFGNVKAKSIKVAEGNTAYKAVDDILYSADGKTLVANASASPTLIALKNFSNPAVETIKEYALSLAPFETIELPNLKSIEEHALSATPSLNTFNIGGTAKLGTYIFENSAVKSVIFAEGIRTIPSYTFQNCVNLASVTLPQSLNVIMLKSFNNCPALKTMVFEQAVNYIEDGGIPSTIETITCKNINVPIITEALFTEAMSNVTCKVAEKAVADYQKSAGWSFLNIVGDASITGEKQALGCPSGLYFATKTGELMFKDESGVIENTGVSSGLHALQIGAAHDRIYVGSAGEKFTYQDPRATQGDGELFYVNKSGNSFYRVTLVSNIGYDAFEDVFSLAVDAPANKLLVADRNVGIHLIDTERPGLYGHQPFLTENQFLAYYPSGDISYGAIGCGIVRDSEDVYWMGKKFNGSGIFRFKESDIHPDKIFPPGLPYPVLLKGTSMTTFYLDEENGFLYAYLQIQVKTAVPGIYRFALADILAKQGDATFEVDGTLIDDSPVKQEGSAPSELTGVTQISGDGENIYWSYIAPSPTDEFFIGAKPLDSTNPLHKSGIKTISAKGGVPTVTYAVENVEAYGVVPAKYNGGLGVENNGKDKIATKCKVKGSQVEIFADAKVRIVSINGMLCGETMISGNGTVSVEGLSSGLYLIHVMYADGSVEVVKVIK